MSEPCDKEGRHIRLVNQTCYVVGLAWLDDLVPNGSVGLSIADWEMLKTNKGVESLVSQGTIMVEHVNESS